MRPSEQFDANHRNRVIEYVAKQSMCLPNNDTLQAASGSLHKLLQTHIRTIVVDSMANL